MAFDLSKYMTAEERIELFAKDNPDFRYEVEHEFQKDSNGDTWVIVKAVLWRTEVDPNAWTMGLAAENMKTQFAIEKAETSAYARAITNTGKPQFSTTREGEKAPRANRAEMEKVVEEKQKTFKEKLEARTYGSAGSRSAAVEDALRAAFAADRKEPEQIAWSIGDAVDAIGSSTPKEPPACEHGHILKQGISKGKGKPYYGYVCKKGVGEHAKWAKQTANGHWYFEDEVTNG
jgi:hypothetical protein